MNKDSAKKMLGIFKWFYIIGGGFLVLFAVLMFTNANNELVTKVMDEFVKSSNVQMPADISPAILIGIVYAVLGLINLFEAWLFSRVIKDGKKSTLLIVLLVISIISSIYSLVTAFNFSNLLTLCITAITLYAVFVLRKEA